MTTREKWQRMTHPVTVEDYAICVPLKDLLTECPDLYATHIAPILPVESPSSATPAPQAHPYRRFLTYMRRALLLCVLLSPSIAYSQVACFNYGTMLSCNTPSGITNIAPIGPTGGVITEYGSDTNTLEPYTIMAPTPRPRRSHTLDLEPLEPLPTLLEPSSMPGMDLPGLELP